MQRNAGVSASEWRWVIIFSGLLVAATLLPYAWAFASDTQTDTWQFMGILPNPQDSATYLSKIRQGLGGDWLFTLQYTPEPHRGAFINVFYLFLGHVARITGLSPLMLFHIARLANGFIMYLSFYYLGSVIWARVRPRRLFFSLLAVGSGLGWLYILLAPGGNTMNSLEAFNALPTDFSMPETVPLYATFVNPHFPLTFALLALLASIFISVFRPGFNEQPRTANGGLAVLIISTLLAIVQPQGLIPIMSALVLYVIILAIRKRQIPWMEFNWGLLVILPALPFLVYYLALVRENPAMQVWNEQNVTPSPPLLNYLFGFGLLLLVAIPGFWRGIRQFERDGDRFMLIWFVVNVLLLYAPMNLQRRLAIGLIMPIVYFAVRALEDYWFHRVQTPLREAAMIALFVFVVPSNILAVGIPVFGVINPDSGIKSFQLLPAGQGAAIMWLRNNAHRDDVVLAPAGPSLWIPAYSDSRVVAGHPYETLFWSRKSGEVGDWYAGNDCETVLQRYDVQYVISDVQSENTPPQDACFATLGEPVASFGNVFIYKVE